MVAKKGKPATPELFVEPLILKGVETQEIIDALNKAFPNASQAFTARFVSYNRTFLRKRGFEVPRSGRSDRGKVRGPNRTTTQSKAAPKSKAPAKPKTKAKKPAAKRPASKPAAKRKVAPKKKAPAKKKPAAKRPAAKKPAKKTPKKKAASPRSKAGAKSKTKRPAKKGSPSRVRKT